MFHVVLVAPEIPPNTGNVIRLCANTGCDLHLVEPLGFTLDDRQLKRAGLDYHEYTRLKVHADWRAFVQTVRPARLFAFTTRGAEPFASARFEPGDALVFGSETRGLGDAVLDEFTQQQRLRLPMREGSRSLNLSNAVAIAVYEAWRQNGFAGGR
ncbi:tRNA (uridine(34)/cytosine(34)/5-carboxymethylaminomethyluridine(34)-2'-O)-methyltransferase TrmL [soil metagenome]